MGLLDRLLGRKAAPAPRETNSAWQREYLRRVTARYDAAQTTVENERYWAHATFDSPQSANSVDVRKTVRQRARYEVGSNSYAAGMVTAKTYDVIGTGPRIQFTTESREFNETAEREFMRWSREVNMARKLRCMYQAKLVDGETFAQRILNPRLTTPVQLDFLVTECDLWTDPTGQQDTRNYVDGIRYDRARNPVSYQRLLVHPGDDNQGEAMRSRTIQATDVIHWFRVLRADQVRGISEFLTCLPFFAELRRYQLATVAAAEIASTFAGVMWSDAPYFGESPDEPDNPFEVIDLETRRALLTLPPGWKMSQLKAEQPTAQYGEFSDQVLKQIGRAAQMPLNILSGSSRDYNFASGRLDYLLYWNNCDVEQSECEHVALDKLLGWWLDEALLIPNYLPPLSAPEVGVSQVGLEERAVVGGQYRWVFPPRRPVDEEASAKADEIRFHLGHLTDDDFARREGQDLEEYYDRLERMYQNRDRIGAPTPGVRNVQNGEEETQSASTSTSSDSSSNSSSAQPSGGNARNSG